LQEFLVHGTGDVGQHFLPGQRGDLTIVAAQTSTRRCRATLWFPMRFTVWTMRVIIAQCASVDGRSMNRWIWPDRKLNVEHFKLRRLTPLRQVLDQCAHGVLGRLGSVHWNQNPHELLLLMGKKQQPLL
jgi:hypothetical protein